MRNIRSHPTQDATTTRNSPTRLSARSRRSRAVAQTMGSERLRRFDDAGQRRHRYRGVNLFVLGMSPLAFTSGDPRWCSYRQAAARGWQVRKVEKATPVYFYKPIGIEDKTADRGRETRCIPMLRTFSVFHASQIDGVPALTPPTATKTVPERVQDVELIIEATSLSGDYGRQSALSAAILPPRQSRNITDSIALFARSRHIVMTEAWLSNPTEDFHDERQRRHEGTVEKPHAPSRRGPRRRGYALLGSRSAPRSRSSNACWPHSRPLTPRPKRNSGPK